MTTNKVYYIRESALQSILSDIVSFGFIFAGFLVNGLVLGGQWYLYLFWMYMFFIFLSTIGNNKFKTFNSDKELIEFLKSK